MASVGRLDVCYVSVVGSASSPERYREGTPGCGGNAVGVGGHGKAGFVRALAVVDVVDEW